MAEKCGGTKVSFDEFASQSPSQALWAGLTSPTLSSLLLATAVAAAVGVACATLATESTMAQTSGWFRKGADDVAFDVTTRALALKGRPGPRHPIVLVGEKSIGRSSDDSPSLRSPNIVDLRTPGQTLLESQALVDQIPPDSAGMVVLVVSPEVLQVGNALLAELEDRRRLGVRSLSSTVETMRRGVAAIPLRGNYFIDNQSFWLSRTPNVVHNLIHRQRGDDVLSSDHGVLERQAQPSPIDAAVAADLNLATLERLLGHWRRIGITRPDVVFWTDSDNGKPELWKRIEGVAGSGFARVRRASPETSARIGLPADLIEDLVARSKS